MQPFTHFVLTGCILEALDRNAGNLFTIMVLLQQTHLAITIPCITNPPRNEQVCRNCPRVRMYMSQFYMSKEQFLEWVGKESEKPPPPKNASSGPVLKSGCTGMVGQSTITQSTTGQGEHIAIGLIDHNVHVYWYNPSCFRCAGGVGR